MINLDRLSEEELYELGLHFGKMAQSRPDIAHRVVVGFRDGLESWGVQENLGDICWALWRQGEFNCPKKNLSIPFASLQPRPSGVGSK